MEKSTASRVLLTLFRILFTLFVLWTILFIFRNSLESGVLSSARSQAVTAAVNQHLGRVGLSPLSNALVLQAGPLRRISAAGLRVHPVPAGVHPPLHPPHQLAPAAGPPGGQRGRDPAMLCGRPLQQSSGRVDRLRRLRLRGCGALCALVLIGGLLSLAGFGRKC